jgi:hypothetical protein
MARPYSFSSKRRAVDRHRQNNHMTRLMKVSACLLACLTSVCSWATPLISKEFQTASPVTVNWLEMCGAIFGCSPGAISYDGLLELGGKNVLVHDAVFSKSMSGVVPVDLPDGPWTVDLISRRMQSTGRKSLPAVVTTVSLAGVTKRLIFGDKIGIPADESAPSLVVYRGWLIDASNAGNFRDEYEPPRLRQQLGLDVISAWLARALGPGALCLIGLAFMAFSFGLRRYRDMMFKRRYPMEGDGIRSRVLLVRQEQTFPRRALPTGNESEFSLSR